METLKHPGQYVKAIFAAIIAFVTPIATYLQLDDANTLSTAPQGLWAGAILVALTAFGGVFGLRNSES